MQRNVTAPLISGALDAAVLIDDAIAGGLQEMLADGKTLRIIESRGLPPSFIDTMREINLSYPTTCAQACVERRRVVMRDVLQDPVFAPFAPLAAEAGFRAMQSAPLFDSRRQLRGALSTQFAQPHHPGPDSQADLDRCCRVAALALEARALGVDSPSGAPEAARTALDAATQLIATLRPHNLRLVLDAVIANLEVSVSELHAVRQRDALPA